MKENTCTCTTTQAECSEGKQLFATIREHIKTTKPATFYDLPCTVQDEAWTHLNSAMDTYLKHCHAPISLIWKIEQIHTSENTWIIDQVLQWVKDGMCYPQLHARLAEWQIGFRYDEPYWSHCTTALELIRAALYAREPVRPLKERLEAARNEKNGKYIDWAIQQIEKGRSAEVIDNVLEGEMSNPQPPEIMERLQELTDIVLGFLGETLDFEERRMR